MRSRAAVLWNKMMEGLTVKKILLILLGAVICSFGIHNIHQRTNITEGGVIGLMLFAEHWLKFSPAYITPILDIACYLLAFRFLGGGFIKISIISTFFVSLFYKIWELFPPMLPDLSNRPLIAASVSSCARAAPAAATTRSRCRSRIFCTGDYRAPIFSQTLWCCCSHSATFL